MDTEKKIIPFHYFNTQSPKKYMHGYRKNKKERKLVPNSCLNTTSYFKTKIKTISDE